MKIWEGNWNTTPLFSLKGLEILHQERRGQVKTIVWNTSMTSSSTSVELLTRSLAITHQMIPVSAASAKNYATDIT